MSFADLARRTFRRAVASRTVSARNKVKLAVILLEDRTVPATIEGTIFYDANANEIQDSGEGFAEGIGVMLSPFDGSSMFATTDANGHYAFTGVSPGSYGINVNSMPSGYTAEAINGNMVGIASDTDDVGVGFGLAGGGGGSSSGSGPPPTISVSESDTTEGVIVGSSGYFRFTRSGSTANDVTVNYTLGGTATSGTDYSALSGSVTIPSGQTSADADVTALADNLVEGNETIIATISSNSAYAVGDPASATLTITDDPPIVSLSAANTTEGGSPGYVEFTRSGGNINSALSVTYTASGTATSGTDYSALTGTATIPAGQSSFNENITALRDNLVEGDETVILTMTDTGTTYLAGASSSATVTISDDPPIVSLTAADTTEGRDPGYVTFTRTGGDINSSLSVSYTIGGTATAGTDYTAVSGAVSIPAGLASINENITALRDNLVEGDETVILTISGAGTTYIAGSPSTATVTIADDPPIVSLTVANTTEGQDPGYVTFTRAGGDINSALSVSYTIGGTATAGADYTALSGAVTIPAGQSSVNENITALRDNLVEDNETVTLEIFPTSIYLLPDQALSFTAVVTITDEPPVVSVNTINDASEPDSNGLLRFTRAGGDLNSSLSVSYSVGGTATPDADYAALSGAVEFPAGESTVDVTLTVIDDTIIENDESVVATVLSSLNNNVGMPGVATVMIADNDKLILTAPTTNIPINANRDDKSPWKVVAGVTQTGIPLLRDMDIAPIRDLSSWDGTGNPPAGAPINDPDLKQMTATVVNGDATGQITVTVIYADGVTGGRISLWADQSKTTPILQGSLGISPGGSATLPGYPTSTFYVEGIRPSQSAGDITLRLSYTQAGVTTTKDQKLTVTPVINAFSVSPKDPAATTFAKSNGIIAGITSADFTTGKQGVTYNADLNVNGLGGVPGFVQNITSITYGNPAVVLTDGSEYNPTFGTATFPILDYVDPGEGGAIFPFYPSAQGAVFSDSRKTISSFDSPVVGSALLFAGKLSSMDYTFQARMYLTWYFPDGTIYSLARDDWQSVFKASTNAAGVLSLDPVSVTTASPMVIGNANPATLAGDSYNTITRADGFWVEE